MRILTKLVASLRQMLSRQENAFYKSQRLACAQDLGLPETATWREIVDACDQIAPLPASLLRRAGTLPPTAEGNHIFGGEILQAALVASQESTLEQLKAALRVEQRLMGLRLGPKHLMSRGYTKHF